LPTEKSDFYTETEIASLFAAAAAKNKKKKKVLRKSGDDADSAMIGTTVDPHLVNDNIKISDSHKLISDIRKQQGLVDMDGVRKSEDIVTSAIGGSDLGSRSQRRAQAENQAIIDAAAASERGNKAFEAAYEKAAMMTKAKLGHIASSTGVSNVYNASENNRPNISLISAKTLCSSTGRWTDATTESGMNNTESNVDEMESTNPVQLALRTQIRAAAEASHRAQVSNLNKATHQRAYSRLRSIGGGFDTGEGEADDAELQAALSRARRLTVKHEQILPPLYSSSSSSSFSSNVVSSENSRAGVFVGSQPTNKGGSLLVFDDVSGFSRRMEAQHILEESEEKSQVQLSNSAAVPEVTLAQPLLKTQDTDQDKKEKDVNGDDNDSKDDDEDMEIEDDDEEDMEIEDDDMVVNEDVGARFDSSGQEETKTTTSSSLSIQGIAGALKLFQNTGAITSKKTIELKGRTKDKRTGDLVVPIAEIGGGTKFSGGGISGKLDEFVIEYKDEHGKKLTTKEAYRQLSYKFHGKMPSKSVLDKRLKKAKREEKISKVGLGETPLQTALLRAQEVKASAFVVLEKS
jgi:U4/U6.U5 tri-snRNP-associated protein 1